MRSRKRNAFRTLLVVLMLVMLFPGVTAHAASKKKALKAYKKLLSKNTIMIAPKNATIWPEIKYKGTKKKNARFSLAYLDSDKVPELFVYDPSAGYAVFRYKKGKAVRAGYELYWTVPKGYYYKTGIYRTSGDVEGYIFYDRYNRYSSGKFTQIIEHNYCEDYDDDDNRIIEHEYRSYPGAREITKGRFDALLKNYTKGRAMTGLVLRKNTAKNRKKYLK